MARQKSKSQNSNEVVSAISVELEKQDDRGLAILSVAYIDHLLKDLLVSIMDSGEEESYKLLFDDNYAPLGSLGAKITLTYCLGEIDKDQRQDLRRLKDIRNLFAHQLLDISSFEDEIIQKECQKLKSAIIDGIPSNHRDYFIKSSIRMIMHIMARINENDGMDKSDV